MWSIPANRSYNGLGGSHCSPWSWLTLLIYGQKKQCLPQWSRVRAEPSLSLCCTGALSETRVLLFLLLLSTLGFLLSSKQSVSLLTRICFCGVLGRRPV